MASKSPARALPLLQITETGVKFDLEAFKSVLDQAGDLPIIIYTVIGETRSGKSYLLNFFLKYFETKKQKQKQKQAQKHHHERQRQSVSEDNWMNFTLNSHFPWGSGKDTETRGMNLWSEPYFCQSDKGPTAVLLMDTQGLFDDRTTAQENAIIFSLVAWLSSVIIFNTIGEIKRDVLQQIQYFSSYAQTVSQGKPIFQKLLLLLRDFESDGSGYAHGLHEKDRKPTDSRKNFMVDTFNLEGLPTIAQCPSQENIMVRQGILENFHDVATYLLPRPAEYGSDTYNNNNNDSSDPDDIFYSELKSFIEHVTSPEQFWTLRKTLESHNNPCTAREFKNFVGHCTTLVESEEVFPENFLMADRTQLVHYTIAKDMAISYFTQKMDALLFNLGYVSKLSMEELVGKQKSYSNEAKGIFDKMKKCHSNKFDSEFKTMVEDAFGEYLHNSPRMLRLQKLMEAKGLMKQSEVTGNNQVDPSKSDKRSCCTIL